MKYSQVPLLFPGLKADRLFIVHLSYPSMTYGKTIALTGWIFVGKATSRLFNMLSSLVITFLPSHKYVLSSWRQPSPAVISKPPKIVCCCFQCFPIYLPWSDGTRCHDPSFLNVEFQASFPSLKTKFPENPLEASLWSGQRKKTIFFFSRTRADCALQAAH